VVILRVASKENLWERKLKGRLAKIRRQLNTTMEKYNKELLKDSYEDVSRDIVKIASILLQKCELCRPT
jgi:hypothetical protein